MSREIREAHWSDRKQCQHLHRVPALFIHSNNTKHVVLACRNCGQRGTAQPHSDHPDWHTYPVIVRHPNPCSCHPDHPKVTHRPWAKPDYETYLQSEQWAERRGYFIARAMGRCQLCNHPGGPAGAGLHLHHRTYARLGAELDVDVVVLCRGCHIHHHDHMRDAA